jgi:antitoxin YefM
MYMFQLAVSSSAVRDRFSEHIDSVIRKAPQVVNRRNDHFVMMNWDHVGVFLDSLTMNCNIVEDEKGIFIATLQEIDDLYGHGDSRTEAVEMLIKELIEYSYEYLQDSFTLYFNAPNRKKHFPYVFKVMLQSSPAQVLSFINVKH